MASSTFQTRFPAPYIVCLGDVEVGDCCKTGYGLAERASERTLTGLIVFDPAATSVEELVEFFADKC